MSALEQSLLNLGRISEEELQRVRLMSERSSGTVARLLVTLGMIDEAVVAEAVSDACGYSFIRQKAGTTSPIPAPPGINQRFLRRHHAAFVDTSDDVSTIALADPSPDVLAALRFACPSELRPVVTTFSHIEELLGPDDPEGPSDASDGPSYDGDLARLLEDSSDAPIIRLVQATLADAASRRASDVHIEPMARRVAVRFRIDGQLIEAASHAAAFAAPIASRIKVMAGLDIAETRLPQDGRLKLIVRGREVDVRVSTSPIAHGEGIVLRLLGRSELPLELERLGLPGPALAKLCRALDRPHGIVLLTGPTGSGKTTTLYASLARLRRPEVKILTVEDPVEVMLDGVNQVQVRPEIGLSYAQTLRAFLRQDPDVLMIGEIRDGETAEIALRAALTGHLVLSTLHTNSTVGAFTRLADIGVESYLAASTVNAVIAQRLIRTLCVHCHTTRATLPSETALFVRSGIDVPAMLHEPTGCPACQGTGYRGRAPLVEVLEIDPALRDAIRDGSIERMSDILPPAETLLGHGLALAASGSTSIAEVYQVVQSE